jgi:hypothetical protein
MKNWPSATVIRGEMEANAAMRLRTLSSFAVTVTGLRKTAMSAPIRRKPTKVDWHRISPCTDNSGQESIARGACVERNTAS